MGLVVDGLGDFGGNIALVHGEGAGTFAVFQGVTGVALPVVGEGLVEANARLFAHQTELTLGRGGKLVADCFGNVRLWRGAGSGHHAGSGVGSSGNAIDGRQRDAVLVGLATIAPAGQGGRAVVGSGYCGADIGLAVGQGRTTGGSNGQAGGHRRWLGKPCGQFARPLAIEQRLPVVREDVQRLAVKEIELPVVVAAHAQTIELVALPSAAAKGREVIGAVGFVRFNLEIVQGGAVFQVLVFAIQGILGASVTAEHTGLDAAGVSPAAIGLVNLVVFAIDRLTVELPGGRSVNGVHRVGRYRQGQR